VVFADTGLFEYGDARWVGNEDGRVPYETWNVIDRHGYLRWRPVEADTPLRAGHWFWHPNDEASLKTVDELLTTWDDTVGHGAQLMLGLAPDRRGLLPESDVARLEEFGRALHERYAHNLSLEHAPVAADVGAALDGDPDTFWSAPAGSHHSVLEVRFNKPVTFNRALTMEWLNDGQRIENYSIDVWTGSAWKPVASAHTIGHEKIDIFPIVTASRVRLNILSSTDGAAIREFQLYDVQASGGR
jgi:alpha-L-fucosidase